MASSKNKNKNDGEGDKRLFHSTNEDSDSSLVSMVTVSSASSRTRSKTRGETHLAARSGESEAQISSGNESDDSASKTVPQRSRGRGRPPTTGAYVGLLKAKQELNKAKEKELQLEAERQLAEEQRQKKERSHAFLMQASRDREVEQSCDAAKMERLVSDSIDTIIKVATKSRNLKGTYVAALKDAARTMQDSFNIMRDRTSSEEVTLLIDANRRLTEELKEIRRELEEMRANQAKPLSPPTAASTTTPDYQEMLRAVMVQVGTMINARFEGFEERLLPEKRVRPPLAADKKQRQEAVSDMEDPSTSTAMEILDPPLARGPEFAKGGSQAGRKKKKKVKTPLAKQASTAPTTVPSAPTQEQQWTTVVRKGSRKNVRTMESDRTRSLAPKQLKAQKLTLPTTKVKAAKLRSPRTAAVVITLGPEAAQKGITYAKVLSEAKSQIDLAALEIPPLKMRAAATGARVLEVPGEGKDEKADSLAVKLREVFKDSEDVKVSRPITTADLRVSGLDDSITSSELMAAVGKAGECDILAIKVGEIKKGPAGMGISFVKCPVAAARKIASSGRLMVGWVAAQVRLLDVRPRRCYRCLAPGHVRAQCKSEVDRSDECHRCGKKGHKANECSSDPHCNLCADVGKPSEHLPGGKACAKPPSKTRGKKKPAATKSKLQPASSVRQQEEVTEDN